VLQTANGKATLDLQTLFTEGSPSLEPKEMDVIVDCKIVELKF
jgi:hypothetical protein